MRAARPWPVLVVLGFAVLVPRAVSAWAAAPAPRPTATAPSAHALARSQPGQPSAPPPYTVIDLGTLGGTWSQATGINARGQIVGYAETANGERHAFLWQDGTMTDLGTLGGKNSAAAGINNAGEVVGEADTTRDVGGGIPQAQTHAVLWQDGRMTDLGTLGGIQSAAYDINAVGQVVGWAANERGEHRAALWWDRTIATPGAHGGTAGGATAAATGVVTYRGRIALPEDAVVIVRIEDSSRADAPAAVIGEQVIATRGRQMPIPFAVPSDPARIDPNGRYGLRSRIEGAGGELRWTTVQASPVITGGNPTSDIARVLLRVPYGMRRPWDGVDRRRRVPSRWGPR